MRLELFRQRPTMMRLVVVLFSCVLSLSTSSAAWFGKKKASAPKDYERDVKPLLQKYCYGCHGETKKKGGLSLQAFNDKAAVLNDKPAWEKVLHNLQTKEMPPENKPQPSAAERTLVAKWIEADVFNCDCDHPDPGRVTVRRLNRAEYNNTIRDLLGVDFHAAKDFPPDDTGYGFDNNGDVLSLPPILLEKYMAAAAEILSQAIVTDFSTNSSTRFQAENLHSTGPGQIYRTDAFRLTREGELFSTFNFPRAGDYIFRAKAFGEQAGSEPARMELRINGEILKTFDVKAVEKNPAVYEIRIATGPGEKRISAAYINNYRDPDNSDPARRDRNLVVDFLENAGPTTPATLPATHKRIFPKPIPVSAHEQESYAREIISDFARRAFRRPVSNREVDRLAGFVKLAQSEGDSFEGGIKLAFQAILVSPQFLFRGEAQTNPDNPKSVQPVDEFALASRLSYFLWSSMPDDELFQLAARGKLRKNLESQVRRMLRDKKSSALVKNFGGQWLQTRNLDFVQPDTDVFPSFNEKLRSDMRKETELFLASLLRENRSVMELLNADYTFLNERLARLYGIPGVTGENFRRVSLKGTGRGGILTQASILTLTSNPTRTSLVKRGKWVLENILGAPPPPQPPGIPSLKEGKATALTGTHRERLEQHRSDPNCYSCHARMDPIGFAFENFDGIGAWREKEDDLPIDATGKLFTGESFDGASELRKIIVASKREEFVRCLSEKLLTYALGRGLEMYDRCAIDEIAKRVAKHGYKFDDLIVAAVKSIPFQMRRGEERGLAQTSN
jgi:hypothetical protein